MNITKIKVTAGRTFNHPYEQFSNLRPEVTMEADLSPGEDATAAVKELQARAEGAVEDHKQGLLKSLEEIHQLTERQREVRGLERELQRTQQRLTEIREQNPQLVLTNEPNT